MLYITYPSWLSPEIIPGFPVRWYGLMYLFAFATCYFFTQWLLKKDENMVGIAQKLSNVFFWTIIGLLVGARFVSEFFYSKNYMIIIKPWELFWPFDSNMNYVGLQGMSYHGGLIGSVLFFSLYCMIARIPVFRLGDKMVIGAALGYGFGRLGNFINAELYGRITASPLGMVFPNAERLPYGDIRVQKIADAVAIEPDSFGLVNVPRHPSQLYEVFTESIIVFIILFILYKVIYKTKFYMPGMMIPLYIIGYSAARFIVEYFRQPDAGLDFVVSFSDVANPRWLLVTLWNFTIGQVFSFVLALISAGVLLFFFIRHCRQQKNALL